MDREIVSLIDTARAEGMTPKQTAKKLRAAGVENVDLTIDAYREIKLPDGRRRDEVNPGDPAER